MAVIALDLGTTVCKAAVFDGPQMIAVVEEHYRHSSREEGLAEQDAEQVWLQVTRAVRQALEAAHRPAVQAVCVSVQGDAVIPIDAKGQALQPAILGMDTRSHQEAADLEARFGRGPLYAWTGMPCEPLNAITKILWLVRHRADLRRRVWKYVHYEEFLFMKIAGVTALDFSMASRTMAFDPVRKEWVAPVLDFVGVTPSQLGNVSPSGVPIGIVRSAVADAWGIGRHVLVIAGGHNQCMAAVGAGVIEPDLGCYSMDAAEVISLSLSAPRTTPAMLASNYPCYCHAASDRYFTITLNQSGGLSLDWCLDLIAGPGETRASEREGEERRWLNRLRLVPSAVLFLPHLVGSGTPTCDHLSRASFVGCSLKTTTEDLFQAVADALAYEARVNLDSLEHLGIPVRELRVVGRGANSEVQLALKATVLERPLHLLKNRHAALVGAAVTAQLAVGVFATLDDAVKECVTIERTIEPERSAIAAYRDGFERYRHLYGTLKSFYHHWRRLPAAAGVASGG
jgi:xylulokinase